ncbi:MAG: succinate dehydrogenase assembly factor 2 [Pseudomonadota bacterium]
MPDSPILSKLRWACRRGMLELDVLLGNFLEEAFATASTTDQALFVQLLDNNDQDLFTWLTGRATPENEKNAIIVAKIRDHAFNRH